MAETDPRWIREGRDLRSWLLDLVHDDPAVRRRAENAISAMHFGAPVADQEVYKYVPKDWDGHRRDFNARLAAILTDPAFPGQQYVQQAIARRRQDFLLNSQISAIQVQLFDNDLDEDAQKALLDRCAKLKEQLEVGRLCNSQGMQTLAMVLRQSGPILCQIPDVARDALRDDACSREAAEALAKVGPAAHQFLQDLEGLRTTTSGTASASVGRDDPSFVARLLEKLRDTQWDRQSEAWTALAKLGTRAAQLRPQIVDELLALLPDEARTIAVLLCIGQVAPGRRDAFERVLQLARPAEPDWRTYPEFPGQQFDDRLPVRGAAIEALGYFTDFADQSVPVLAEALESFEEYDPDWGYENEEHGRVVRSLAKTPAAATAIVPTLIRHIRMSDGDLDMPVIKLLGKIGPAARDALPMLRELAENGQLVKWSTNPPTEALTPLGWAICRIEGRI
jgi:hypothetical protein